MIAWNEIRSGQSWPAECNSVIIIGAHVNASPVSSSQFAVNNLTVQMNDGARYRAAIDATRAVVLRAAKARDSKQNDEVNKRGAPKL